MYEVRLPVTSEVPPFDNRIRCGYGDCTHRDYGVKCLCPAYSGQGNLCENCGHQYSDHT